MKRKWNWALWFGARRVIRTRHRRVATRLQSAVVAVVDTVLIGKSNLVRSCERGIKRLLMFEHTEADVDELAHNSANDGHFGFAGGLEFASKVP